MRWGRTDTDTLPVKLSKDRRTATVGLYVGDDLDQARRDGTLDRAVLRVRLERFDPADRVGIALNDRRLDEKKFRVWRPTEAELAQWLAGTASWTYERTALKGPWAWMEIDLCAVLPCRGNNRVTVRWESREERDTLPHGRVSLREEPPVVTDVELKVTYRFCGKDETETV